MKKDQVYVDEHGVVWITAAKVAEKWNEIAKRRDIDANYTRWSVYQRRDDLPHLDTPLGRLFREDKIVEATLRPRTTKGEDVARRNTKRARGYKADDDTGQGGKQSALLRAGSNEVPVQLKKPDEMEKLCRLASMPLAQLALAGSR